MDKVELERLIADDYTVKRIAESLGSSQTNVRYWLKKHGLRTRRGPHGTIPVDLVRTRICPCGETDPAAFYPRSPNFCKRCKNDYTQKRQNATRRRALAFLGGRCTRCGFDDERALEIHHSDPSLKDPAFSSMRGWSWARVQAELEAGCVLLCRNCHAITHALLV